jgi:hypothetical protein
VDTDKETGMDIQQAVNRNAIRSFSRLLVKNVTNQLQFIEELMERHQSLLRFKHGTSLPVIISGRVHSNAKLLVVQRILREREADITMQLTSTGITVTLLNPSSLNLKKALRYWRRRAAKEVLPPTAFNSPETLQVLHESLDTYSKNNTSSESISSIHEIFRRNHPDLCDDEVEDD